MSAFTPEQREAWRAEQRLLPKWRPLYGWRSVPAIEEEQLIGWERKFSHVPGTLLITASKSTKGEPRAYLVWADQSLRRITMAAAEKLALARPELRLEQAWKEAA